MTEFEKLTYGGIFICILFYSDVQVYLDKLGYRKIFI